MLSSATVMIAPAFTKSVYDLTPAEDSVGMVREVAIPVESSLIELKNGVAQATVDSKRTNVSAMISFTCFEFTAANAQRALGLASATAPAIKRGVLTTAAVAEAVTLVMSSDPVPGDAASALTVVGDIPSGATILLQHPNGTDYVFPTKTSGVTTLASTTFTTPIAGNYKIPLGMTFPIGTKVWIVPAVQVAHIGYDDLFGVKIVGTLSNYDRPIVFVAPKVKIGKGFNLNFTETDYGGMPFELKPLLMSLTEATGRLADIGTKAPADVYIGA
jgi:hypothetical protein